METAREFLERRARHAKPKDLIKCLRKAGRKKSGGMGPPIMVSPNPELLPRGVTRALELVGLRFRRCDKGARVRRRPVTSKCLCAREDKW
jgi:hypothetical protein